jgi:hypothetical protein
MGVGWHTTCAYKARVGEGIGMHSKRSLVAAAGALCLTGILHGQPAVLTWHNDNARTGQNLQETTLTPSNVNTSTFGKLFIIPMDGKVDAQPLFVPALAIPGAGTHNVLYVATEHDTAYAFDADTGAVIWQVSLLGAGETTSDDRGCFQVVPEIGVTATPAIDLQAGSHGTIYAVAMSKDASGSYHHRLHALDLTTGAEEFGGPAEIQASVPGTGVEGSGSILRFDPKVHKERAALLIANGIVYTSWSSHCDNGNYTSWVIGYDEATLRQASAINLTANGNGGGMWAAGAGPAADAAGNLFVTLGNGTFDTTLDANGFPARGDYGNAFVRLSPAGGNLSVTDYFTMANTVAESTADTDLGSGGLMLLPSLNDSQGNPRALAVGSGKDGTIYVVDQNNLGQFNPQRTPAYQAIAASPVYSSPAWFNGMLYYGTYGIPMKAFTFTNGSFVLASQTPNPFFYPGTTPSISANGTSNGIVWAVSNDSPAVLHAFDAADLSKEIYNSSQAPGGRDNFGAGNKFIVPTIANGKVYVGTTTGIGVFGLLNASSGAPTLAATNTHAGSFTAGQNGAAYSITVQNTGSASTSGAVTVTDTLPSAVNATSIAGTGWSCTQPAGPCTRSDALGAGSSYPLIMLTVNIASNAAGSVVNTVTVSGGGAANTSTASDTAIVASGLAAPALTSPFNGATGTSLTPALIWNAVPGASSYEVYFGTASNPPLVMNTVSVFYAFGTSSALSSNATYFWRIVSKNGAGSLTSPTWSFTTGAFTANSGALAHVAAGDTWTTGIFVLNTGAAAAQFSISFFDDNGTPIALPFSTGSSATLSGSIAAQGSAYYEASDAQIPLITGSGQFSAGAGIVIQALFRNNANGTYYEAAVPSTSGTREFLIPSDATTFSGNGQPFYTGLAIANLDAVQATVTCTARDPNGAVLPGAVPVPVLPALGHWANFSFPVLAGQRGTIDCVSNTNISAVALRFIGVNAAFSSLPVIVK